MSGTDVVETKSFQERMFERVRDSIGDLMTEEELKKVVETAMQKAFFEPTRTISHWSREEASDSLFVKEVRKLLEPMVREAVRQWIANNDEKVQQMMREVIDLGIAGAFMNSFRYLAQTEFAQAGESLLARLRSL